MRESFLYGEKHVELLINKTEVIIVLAIFICSYIPDLFMDVNMQSSFFFFFANFTDGILLPKKG